MARVNIRREQSDKLEPWQLFDLIAGTSTGGYVALLQAQTTATLSLFHLRLTGIFTD